MKTTVNAQQQLACCRSSRFRGRRMPVFNNDRKSYYPDGASEHLKSCDVSHNTLSFALFGCKDSGIWLNLFHRITNFETPFFLYIPSVRPKLATDIFSIVRLFRLEETELIHPLNSTAFVVNNTSTAYSMDKHHSNFWRLLGAI